MKKIFAIIGMLLLVLSITLAQSSECNGEFWTTQKEGMVLEKDNYHRGQIVYIHAEGLMPNAECSFDVVRLEDTIMSNGTVTTDSNGDIVIPQFVFDTTYAPTGEYRIDLSCSDSCTKSDDFEIKKNSAEVSVSSEVPEFGFVGAVLAIGLAGAYAFAARKK